MSDVYQSTTVLPFRPRIDKAFEVINRMVADGVIESYAIGGATGAFFYLEPDTTYDVDIFCVISGVEEDALDMLRPIYDYLTERGYKPEAEAINIAGIPVQFLPVFNPLNEEAVEHAREFDYMGVRVKVMSPEHLVAIMLQTGRTKDYVRVARFIETDAFDPVVLDVILSRHGLTQAARKTWRAVKILERRVAE